ncbi:MAG: TRAP transporter small permease [Brooklawnia sp.]|nr:TRAP transporter small permease [Brooklawnia sp.]
MKPLKIPKAVLNLDYVITGAMFVVLVVVTFFGVIFRYALGDPFAWLEEVQLMLFVGITYLGGGAAFRAGAHVAIEFVVEKLPRAAQKVAGIVISAIVIGTLIYFMLRGIDVVQLMAQTSRSTNILEVPYALIYSALPVGCALMIINYILATYFGVREDHSAALEVPQP